MVLENLGAVMTFLWENPLLFFPGKQTLESNCYELSGFFQTSHFLLEKLFKPEKLINREINSHISGKFPGKTAPLVFSISAKRQIAIMSSISKFLSSPLLENIVSIIPVG